VKILKFSTAKNAMHIDNQEHFYLGYNVGLKVNEEGVAKRFGVCGANSQKL